MDAIVTVESGGNCDARGKSGESGCMQWLDSTWRKWSKDVYGYVQEMTPSRERYVAYRKIETWLNDGYSAKEVAAIWNSGSPVGWKNKRGINAHGVAYDVPLYVSKVVALLE